MYEKVGDDPLTLKEYFRKERIKAEFHRGNYLILLEVFALSVLINLIVEIFSRRSAGETFAFLLNSPFVFIFKPRTRQFATALFMK